MLFKNYQRKLGIKNIFTGFFFERLLVMAFSSTHPWSAAGAQLHCSLGGWPPLPPACGVPPAWTVSTEPTEVGSSYKSTSRMSAPPALTGQASVLWTSAMRITNAGHTSYVPANPPQGAGTYLWVGSTPGLCRLGGGLAVRAPNPTHSPLTKPCRKLHPPPKRGALA